MLGYKSDPTKKGTFIYYGTVHALSPIPPRGVPPPPSIGGWRQCVLLCLQPVGPIGAGNDEHGELPVLFGGDKSKSEKPDY